MGPPAGAKRHAADKADGEPRVKRKRIDSTPTGSAGVGHSHAKKVDKGQDVEGKDGLVDFATMPTDALHRYLVQYDLVPSIQPSPLLPDNPPPPFALLHSHSSRASSPQPTTSRRDTLSNRRRSSRLLEEDVPHRNPVLADIGEVHDVLAAIAQKHFREHVVKEVDTLASFMCAVKSKARLVP
ncbi:hypothetical protein JAAARDRAFT_355789 [Jaapia argillacea MUCL 33604]|uniref:Histone deacetylase complex subunit SAP30 Sin3 binding domain-containing protein n=1 Tax=Jaapia argillacea MUCL 33604 TaxID=933084 RepID=A0A067PJA8_9AGAM|nr:hypothetical protein JAAARDRAFT_355789 [Jaapia argillacea MUCL 33604]